MLAPRPGTAVVLPSRNRLPAFLESGVSRFKARTGQASSPGKLSTAEPSSALRSFVTLPTGLAASEEGYHVGVDQTARAQREVRALPGDFCYAIADSRCSRADQSCTSCVDRYSLIKHGRTNRDNVVEEGLGFRMDVPLG
jgi:hypothetical protein